MDRDFPDPDVLQVGDWYYAYATNSDGYHVQVARSDDLVTWEFLGDALPALPEWAVQDFGWTWAPEVTTFDGGNSYLMYYVTRFAIDVGGTQCIGLATADEPEGPFQPIGDEPLVCQIGQGGSIDPGVFVDDDGAAYLLWKNDGNSQGGQSWIYVQSLSNDGRTLEGEPTKLITADQPWEGLLVEAPTLWKHDDRYYLFYSANDYASRRYAIGYAIAEAVTGPYTKPQRTPIFKTSIPGGVVGPGGQDIVLDDDGDTWMLYHAWAAGGYRNLRLAELMWQDGVPVLAEPTREAQAVP
ncbi:MAG: family 43 glycosylhydrolase [Chloroflexi bacterium]|nr:family 43 glycosylhydrolase [Chloroflexota bacterium]